MAEIVLAVRSSGPQQSNYQDGDILCAFNQDHIHHVHAQHICLPRDDTDAKSVNADGFREDSTGLAQLYFDTVYQYRFERVNRTEVKRIRLSDMSEQVFGPTPDIDGKHIDVPAFVLRRLDYAKRTSTKGAGKAMFGTRGAEVWYGGHTTVDAVRLTTIWNAIETHTPKRLVDHFFFPLGRIDVKHFLGLQVDDFTTAERNTLTEIASDSIDDHIIQKRTRFVLWQNIVPPGIIPDILDRTIAVDIRATERHLRADIVNQKP